MLLSLLRCALPVLLPKTADLSLRSLLLICVRDLQTEQQFERQRDAIRVVEIVAGDPYKTS